MSDLKDYAEDKSIPAHLRHFPGLYLRKNDRIVEAPSEDIDTARRYPRTKDKGKIINGKRITIMTAKNRYRIGEEVRVIHVFEAVEAGHEIFVMGPKPVLEFLDDHLATPTAAPIQVYDGPVLKSPGVDYNYEITRYRFNEPGKHIIYWKLDELVSNTIDLEIVP
jgi:hypothetical protein